MFILIAMDYLTDGYCEIQTERKKYNKIKTVFKWQIR
jgi:hypothetical protein